MMKAGTTYRYIQYFIALVWLLNGLFCKILNLTPRHQEIVERILGDSYGRPITILIGISELVMVVWILSQWRSRLCAILQILVIGSMNLIEFFLASDLLLWGHFNIVFAFALMALIYYNEFKLNPKRL